MQHGWLKGNGRDGGVDWLYPGDMVPRTLHEAEELAAGAYSQLCLVADRGTGRSP